MTDPRTEKATRRALAADMPAAAARMAATREGALALLLWLDDDMLAGQAVDFAAACFRARLWRLYLHRGRT